MCGGNAAAAARVATSTNKNMEKKRILDPAHPAFAGMTPDQIGLLELRLAGEKDVCLCSY